MTREPSRLTVGDVIRLPHYELAGGPERKRVWRVVGVHLGATYQEGTYELVPLDYSPNKQIQVPCIMLDSHISYERC